MEVWILAVGLPLAPALPLPVERFPLQAAGSPLAVGLPLAAGPPL